jgi:hypothetical protein
MLHERVLSQEEMDFEEFMGMMSETITDEQLDELSFKLPWEIKVLGYGCGEFSGDIYDDIVISVREKDVTPKKSVDVYFFQNIDNKTYKLIKKRNIKYVDLSIEVAFLVKEGKCFVTNKDNSCWYFTGYEIKDSKLLQVEKQKYPFEFEKAGE